MKAYIGIDPGAAGCAAIITETGDVKLCRFMKATEKEVSEFLNEAAFDYECKAVLEQVGAMPGQGVSSMFNFGDSYGFVRGLLVAHGIPYETKVPRTWQKALGIAPRLIERNEQKQIVKEESKVEFKRRLKEKAEQMFPQIKILNDTADAILIAKFTQLINNQ